MADLNKLAVLLNLANGDFNELANDMQIDADILAAAIETGESSLNRNDRLELDEKLARYERTQLDDFEQAQIEDYTNAVNDVTSVIDDFRNGDEMRKAIVNDRLSLDDLESAYLFFGNGYSTPNIQNKIIEWLNDFDVVTDENGNERKEYHNANTFLECFESDGYHLSDIKDSHFWAWYREIFYGD